MNIIFNFLIFPGFLFTSVVGLLAGWVDRKVTARVQWRVGPPWYQNFADIIKLLGKETIVPQGGAKITFLTAPLLGAAAITVVSTILWLSILNPEKGFVGDLIVVLYLLIIPSLSIIIGGFASKNPLASLGASREMKLVLAYELPFVLAAFIPVIKANSIQLGQIINFQIQNKIIAGQWSGAIGLIVAFMCMQAKLALVPFDIPEAETEIMAGPFIEYSGVTLAMFKLTKAMMLFAVPIFLVVIYLGGIVFEGWDILWGILKYVALLVFIVLVRNTNPRIRIDQALKFFWGPMTILAIIGILLAFAGA